MEAAPLKRVVGCARHVSVHPWALWVHRSCWGEERGACCLLTSRHHKGHPTKVMLEARREDVGSRGIPCPNDLAAVRA
eukprot:10454086-Alexandrium_andersonii.AAC.1